jgi:TetR/AcrR family transcriptional regulator, mexCD-oprJ operon repressor
MRRMTPTLRPADQRTAAQILDAAARVLAERGPSATMASVAVAAGVGRATLYRHFPSRDSLLRALGRTAQEALTRGLQQAELDRVPVEEGIARATRTFLGAGATYFGLVREAQALSKPVEVEATVTRPVRALIVRGVEEGILRQDVDPPALFELYGGLVRSGLGLLDPEGSGVEPVSAAITSVFLDGARAGRPSATRRAATHQPGSSSPTR